MLFFSNGDLIPGIWFQAFTMAAVMSPYLPGLGGAGSVCGGSAVPQEPAPSAGPPYLALARASPHQ